MEFKNFAKGLGTYFFAEVLCLFLAVTLSAVGGGLFRLISCICTIAVLVCVCVNYALNRAKEDQHRKLPNTIGRQLFYSVAAARPFLVLGLTLCLAKAGVLPEHWYRWYKLLDAPFLQLCNLCSMDVTVSSLSWGKTIFLALWNLLPVAAVWVTYALARSGFLPEELQYKKRRS